MNKIGKSIIQYLEKKESHRDDLNGITLFVYEKELKDLSGEITKEIVDLMTKGLLEEIDDYSGQKFYQLHNSYNS